jgi:hypothetical protein
MNKEEFTNLSIGLTRAIKYCIGDFMQKNLTNESYDASDIINILLSSHLSSMVACTEIAAKYLDNGDHEVKEFNRRLIAHIISLHPIYID